MNKKSGLDLNTAFGLLLVFTAIIGGQVLEGGQIGSLVQVAAFLIVIGGTIGAVLLQSPVKSFIHGIRISRWVFFPPAHFPQSLIRQIVNWAYIARRDGLLALEAHVAAAKEPLVKKGLQLLADGSTAEKLREALEIEILAGENQLRQSAHIWEAAGGYAPTIGILGAVIGLIQVMENLSDPSRLGSGIAVAFVATVYGVGFANLICLPIANKLKSIIAMQLVLQEILLDGLVAIANGENPRFIENRLQGYDK